MSWILLYLGPVFLLCIPIFWVMGNMKAVEWSVLGWLVFTFIGIAAKPRTIPEYIMVVGNGLLWAIAILVVLVFPELRGQ